MDCLLTPQSAGNHPYQVPDHRLMGHLLMDHPLMSLPQPSQPGARLLNGLPESQRKSLKQQQQLHHLHKLWTPGLRLALGLLGNVS